MYRVPQDQNPVLLGFTPLLSIWIEVDPRHPERQQDLALERNSPSDDDHNDDSRY